MKIKILYRSSQMDIDNLRVVRIYNYDQDGFDEADATLEMLNKWAPEYYWKLETRDTDEYKVDNTKQEE